MFPKIGHGRTRGMFATLDIEPAELRLARFIDPGLTPPSLPPMQCARHEPLSHAAETRFTATSGMADALEDRSDRRWLTHTMSGGPAALHNLQRTTEGGA